MIGDSVGRTDGDEPADRGASALLGLVLLFGMVIAGSALLFIVGAPMLEALESESERERAHHCMSEADHQLATVATTGEQQTLPNAGGSDCQLETTDDGQIEILWYEDSEYDGDIDSLPWDDDSRTATADLGALEFELDDRTIAHQGGAIWERHGGETTVISEPGISYDGESVQFNLLQLDEDQLSRDDPIARADHEQSARLEAAIQAAASSSDGDNVAIRIESSYSEGWEQHLETALGASENGNVDVSADSGSETVVATIDGVRELNDPIEVAIAEDHGVGGPGADDSRVVHPDDWDSNPDPHLELTVEFENRADEDRRIRPTFEILGEDVDSPSNSPIDIEAGERKTVTLEIPPGDYRDLEPGKTYEYTVTTAHDSLDEYGSFYLGTSDSSFEISDDDIETSESGDHVTISATVTNTGVAEETQDIVLDFGGEITATRALSLDSGGDGTVSWTINESAVPAGIHDFTVRTDDDSATGSIHVESGAAGDGFVISEDLGVQDGPGATGDQRVDVTEATFMIATEIANTDLDGDTQTVELSIPEAGITTTETLSLEPSESETVVFDLETDTLEAGAVYDYTVTTDNTAMSEPGTFYAGEPDPTFELLEADASSEDGTVTITTELQNVGIEEGQPDDLSLDLEYLDGETPEEYDLEAQSVDATFGFGETGTIDWQLNESRLLDGDYEATVSFVTGGESVTTAFDVTLEGDSDETGIAVGEPVAAEVTVIGTQISTYDGDDHTLIPAMLSVVTESGGERTVQHQFENEDGGTNLNTYDSWQQKGGDAWTQSIEIDEEDISGDQVNLTLSATSEYCPYANWCTFDHSTTDGGDRHHYDDDVDEGNAWIDVDATTGDSLPNVRVRDHERDDVPELRTQHDLQLSSDELLNREGLWDHDTQTLDLDESEYVFLFEVTAGADDPDDVDDLWDRAQNTDAGDPNFNDLIVHVDVERAAVDVSNPYITLVPDQSGSTEVGSGDGSSGDDASVEFDIGDGSVSSGDSPVVGTGSSSAADDPSESEVDTGLEFDSDHIVVG